MPEEQHKIGLEYVQKFGAILTANLQHSNFKVTFNAYDNPNKLKFKTETKKEISFDLQGFMKYKNISRDVWIESKGYSEGSNLLNQYKNFIARSFFIWNTNERYQDDIFIFITNVPFGSTLGKKLNSKEFVKASVLEFGTEYFKDLNGIKELEGTIYEFFKNIFPIILTDSYIELISETFKVSEGQSLWNLWRDRENKNLSWDQFEALMGILNVNKKNFDLLRKGEVLNIPIGILEKK
ncbi:MULTISPECIES: hypothetical protein [Psychrilyobacter]|uniref:LysM domain-containing protein n=1 Tax=Psychrilyobacter piezotolerans TaxID=2293438 RepID=A0ABX9KD80_9FUSO|nr:MULTISPECIES: hypothetical protein [Psychrilyobacter]MCS5423201.1 hypothetical protein [Psychrilyobacter sp. S5]NDI77871.1 hypothetical protein [Psychrilyobacter piezotolerans]RDE58768.1 hypothetical protein DV867_15535 [Psychrilyobacter sp. S5]REI39242.1 hypothetical protein DYH56_15535 [Psychrilyobacter piezotolerans]